MNKQITLLDIADIISIELVNYEKVVDLSADLTLRGVLDYAITVDRDRKFIINGHHRVAALHMLGIKRVPASIIDYMNDAITICPHSIVKSKEIMYSLLDSGKIPIGYKSILHLINNQPISSVEPLVLLPINALRKVVVTFGVYDLLHIGHMNFFQRAHAYGDYLIVFVQTDEGVIKCKNSPPIHDQNTRTKMVLALKDVNNVFTYEHVYDTITSSQHEKLFAHVDILVLGEDQNHEGFIKLQQEFRERKCEIITLSRTKGISTTNIKKKIQNTVNNIISSSP